MWVFLNFEPNFRGVPQIEKHLLVWRLWYGMWVVERCRIHVVKNRMCMSTLPLKFCGFCNSCTTKGGKAAEGTAE